jgi:hypothetical protein
MSTSYKIRGPLDIEADIFSGQTYSGFGLGETIVYRKLMMDSNGTYQF